MIDQDVFAVFDFLDHFGRAERLLFESPRQVLVANSLSEVAAVIGAAEQATKQGAYATGFVSYEAAQAFDKALDVRRGDEFPLAWFAVFDGPTSESAPAAGVSATPVTWLPEISFESYVAAVSEIQTAICAGESYQVNYTFRLRAQGLLNPWGTYNHLREVHPSSYNAYINTGRWSIVSNSPELFLSFHEEEVKTVPMKGTTVRGRYDEEDKVRSEELLRSEKNRAEHIMIVDLMRSDLGKIAKIGSVKVVDQFALLPLPTVWQMVSTVSCRRLPGTSFLDMLNATFPPGSVTGAPKAQTMQIIKEQEISPRKVYCGTIGYLKPGGDGVFSVPIRTIVVDNSTGEAECGVGGGITALSNAEDEYDEAIAKSRFLTSQRQSFDLLESILIDDGKLFLLEEHLRRLERSASFFGFSFDVLSLREQLLTYAKRFDRGLRKLRMTVNSDGFADVESAPIHALPKQRVALAKTPVDISGPFVYHKTTQREVYETHKRDRPDVFDVLLWNENGQVTEFTIGNVVVEIDGVLNTPPITSGLLPGVMRQHLLASGEIIERDLAVTDLDLANGIWLINSVRKWLPVEIVH